MWAPVAASAELRHVGRKPTHRHSGIRLGVRCSRRYNARVEDPIRVAVELAWPPADSVDDDQLRDHLIKTYRRSPREIVSLDNAWRVDWSEDDGPSWIVRVASKHRSIGSVAEDIAVLRYLERFALPVERTANELAVSQLDGRAVTATLCVTGIEAEAIDAVWIQLSDFAGRLAALPVPASDTGVAFDVGGYPNYTARKSLADELTHVSNCLSSVERDVPKESAALYDAMRAYVDDVVDFDSLPRGLVHPDLAPVNAFTTTSDELVVVDWAGSGIGPRVASLAVLLAYSTFATEGWLKSRVRAMLSAFAHHVALNDRERHALALLAERRLFVREAMGLCIGIRFGIPPLSANQWTAARGNIATIPELANLA